MGITFRLAAVVAALVLAITGWARFAPSMGGVGSSGAPTPSISASPTPTPEVMSAGEWGPLAPGTHVTGDPFLARVTFTVPEGWAGNVGGPYAVFLGTTTGPDTLLFQVFDEVVADPCHDHNTFLDPQPGPSVDELALALSGLPGIDATPPRAVSLGGHQGKQLTLSVPITGGFCRIWQLPLGATNDMVPGDQQRVWILDVEGQRLVIVAPESSGLDAGTKAQVQAVLDSIHIEPARSASGSPSPLP